MSKRLFAAIEVPARVADSLVPLNPHIGGVRWLNPDQVHLTLGFFGNCSGETEEQLREHLSAISFRAFFLPLLGIGTFGARGQPGVVWIGVGQGHPHLFQLYKRVQEAAMRSGLEPELRAFHPHVTLARCKGVTKQMLKPFLQKHADFDAGMFHVENFFLLSSRPTTGGSIYTRELTVAAQAV